MNIERVLQKSKVKAQSSLWHTPDILDVYTTNQHILPRRELLKANKPSRAKPTWVWIKGVEYVHIIEWVITNCKWDRSCKRKLALDMVRDTQLLKCFTHISHGSLICLEYTFISWDGEYSGIRKMIISRQQKT